MAQLGSSKVFGNLQVTGNIVAGTTITGTTLSISGTATAVTFSGALSGNATTATTLQTARTINETSFNGSANITLNQLYRHDDRTISPSEITTGYMRFGFGAWNNNGVSPYADYLHLRSYTDNSGGNDNLVMFRKDAIGLRLYQQSYGSTTAYASYRDVAFTDSPAFTGQVVVAAGTSAAPAITTTGDTNTGIYFPAADTIAFGEGGTEVMRINSSGNVGIGTTNPLAKLDSAGNIKITSNSPSLLATTTDGRGWRMGNSSSGTTLGTFYIQGTTDNFSSSFIDSFFISSAGNVGIGTASPSQKFEVSGGSAKIYGTTGGAWLFIASPDATSGMEIGFNSIEEANINVKENKDLKIGTNNQTRMVVKSDGNVGIGTTNPTAKLEVAGGISLSGTLTFNGSTGSSGQVLTSQGSSAPIWSNAGTGTVTSVAMTVPTILSVSGTPVTTSGTFAVSLANQNANLVFAGPATGAATTPTFRGLVLADIPDLGASYLKLTGGTLTGGITFSSGSISTATDAIINTVNVGLGAGSIATNTRVGYQSINANTTGVQNTALGYQALKSNTTGGLNTALGYRTLQANTTGTENNAIGNSALFSNTTGTGNVAIGASAMAGSTANTYSVALGWQALAGSTPGNYSIAIGYNSAINSTANYSIGIGYQATARATGNENIGIGTEALTLTTSGAANTAVGSATLKANTTGGGNTAVGSRVMEVGVALSDNTGIGRRALYNNAGGTNIGIGAYAGQSITTGSNNTIIGSLNGTSTLSSTILIGAGTTERLKVDSTGLYVNSSTNNLNDALAIAWLGL